MDTLDLSNLRVLIVEDAPFMRSILRTMLIGFGVRQVLDASDGADGLEQAQAHRPDIIVLDWEMPVLDGLEMLRLIRQPKSFDPYVPIIMLTGHTARSRIITLRDAGATEVVCKPLSAKALYDRIYNVIKNPRPFVKAKGYFGPDRRRFVNPGFNGDDRRSEEPMQVTT
jgi:two-component system, chemotaxis family, chemotaxis protein CheY